MRTEVLSAEQERAAEAESAAADPLAYDHCPACGAELAEDQEWCLECGAAVTQIHAPPDWRIGLVIVLGVMAVVAIIAAVLWP